MQNIALPAALQELARAVAGQGAVLYAVGGCVRNALLGLPLSDIDVASALLPEQVMALDAHAVLVNEQLGTVHLHAGGLTVEHTTFRSESYGSGGGHMPCHVVIGVPLEQDAARRDFTVNALYWDILGQRLVDPTGRGMDDLARRTLSATSADPAVIMRDDALRMLRLVRLAAELGFRVDRATFEFVRRNNALLQDVSRERVAAELKRMLLADGKYSLASRVPAHKRALLLLDACGILGQLFPELAEGRNFGKSYYHKYNVLLHSINACACAPCDVTLRLAALLHDIGKPAAWRAQGNMHGHDARGTELARARLNALRLEKWLIADVCALIGMHMFDLTGQAKDSTVRQFAVRVGERRFEQLIALRRADVLGSGRETGAVATADRFARVLDEMRADGTPFTLAQLAIDGRDLLQMGVAEGVQVGKLLTLAHRYAVKHPARNTREKLLAYVRQLQKNK